jgi:hypothetical protein
MEITITWTKIIVLLSTYFAGRYVYFSYMKWVTGCDDPFDPTVYYKTSSYSHGWNIGYRHGTAKMREKYESSWNTLKTLKKRCRIAEDKLAALEENRPD